jgi:hypothetical protein
MVSAEAGKAGKVEDTAWGPGPEQESAFGVAGKAETGELACWPAAARALAVADDVSVAGMALWLVPEQAASMLDHWLLHLRILLSVAKARGRAFSASAFPLLLAALDIVSYNICTISQCMIQVFLGPTSFHVI